MRRVLLLLVFIALFCSSRAQPGGGGGLFINRLYTADLEVIDISNDPHLKVRTFLLKGGTIERETYVMDSQAYRMSRMYGTDASGGIYFQPHYLPRHKHGAFEETDQRLYITYKGVVTMVDLIGILPENGAGHVDHMDSLVLQPGHFIVKRSFEKDTPYEHWEIRAMRPYMRRGLTLSNASYLESKGLLSHSEEVDASFLTELKLPVHFMARAQYFLELQLPHKALLALRKARKNGGSPCETSLTAQEAYEDLGLLDSAVAEVSKAIACKQYTKEDEGMYIAHYRERAELYITQGKLEEAAKDYDEMVRLSSQSLITQNERAKFYIEVSQEFEKAIFQLNQIILGFPEKDLIGCGVYLGRLSETYFNLGRAEYAYGLTDQAFHHWVKAAECRFQMGLYRTAPTHFDSMIAKHPNSAELYLARAMALQQSAPYLGGGDASRTAYRSALADIEKAKDLGIDDYRIYKLQALSLHQIKEDEAAVEAINTAIEKAPDNSKLYALRYQYREDIGQAKYGDENDPDLLKSKELCRRWKFEKF